jgi:hypothetical protein
VTDLRRLVQATPAINKARHEPTRKNFIKQISKMWPAECCEGAKSWGPVRSHGRTDCSRISQRRKLRICLTIMGCPVFLMLTLPPRATQDPA